jgi:hypothetical protein
MNLHRPALAGRRVRVRCSTNQRTRKKLLAASARRNTLMSLRNVRWSLAAALACAAAVPAVAAAQTIGPAQTAVDPNPGKVSLTAAYDFTNAYMFRGLRQDDTRVIMFPSAEARIDVHDDDDGLNDVAVRIGSWNSLHTGAAGAAGPSNKLWYESRFYSGVDFTFGPGVTVGGSYIAYPSPNNSFSTVKELALRVSADERVVTAGFVLRPHALMALEFDTAPGLGQADGGQNGGTYLELGIAPGVNESGFGLAFPIKVGLSLNDYYELRGVDHTFGFLSLGAIATAPIFESATYGTWHLRGGVEFQSLGDTPEAFNGGDQSKVIGTIGVGFSY